eukprot:PhF_6_TR19481/c0_g1_i1/m.28464
MHTQRSTSASSKLKEHNAQKPSFAGDRYRGCGRATIGTFAVGYYGFLPGTAHKICTPHEAQLVMSELYLKAQKEKRQHQQMSSNPGALRASSASGPSRQHQQQSPLKNLSHFTPLISPASPQHILGYSGHRMIPPQNRDVDLTGKNYNLIERLHDTKYAAKVSYEEMKLQIDKPFQPSPFRSQRVK